MCVSMWIAHCASHNIGWGKTIRKQECESRSYDNVYVCWFDWFIVNFFLMSQNVSNPILWNLLRIIITTQSSMQETKYVHICRWKFKSGCSISVPFEGKRSIASKRYWRNCSVVIVVDVAVVVGLLFVGKMKTKRNTRKDLGACAYEHECECEYGREKSDLFCILIRKTFIFYCFPNIFFFCCSTLQFVFNHLSGCFIFIRPIFSRLSHSFVFFLYRS